MKKALLDFLIYAAVAILLLAAMMLISRWAHSAETALGWFK